jgi:hypothetical protein
MVNISSTQDAVIGDVEIAASPETVFAAITDPEQLKQWWGDGKNYKVERWEGEIAWVHGIEAWAAAIPAIRLRLPANTWRWSRRGCWRTHGKPVGPREYQPVWFVGN